MSIIKVMKDQKRETSATEMIMISRAEYDAQKEQIAKLFQKVNWLMEQLRLLKKKQFGPSSGPIKPTISCRSVSE